MVFGGGTCTACYCFRRRRKRHIQQIYETVTTTYDPVYTAAYGPVATTDGGAEVVGNDEEQPEEETVEKINIAPSPHDILYEETLPLKLDKWTM